MVIIVTSIPSLYFLWSEMNQSLSHLIHSLFFSRSRWILQNKNYFTKNKKLIVITFLLGLFIKLDPPLKLLVTGWIFINELILRIGSLGASKLVAEWIFYFLMLLSTVDASTFSFISSSKSSPSISPVSPFFLYYLPNNEVLDPLLSSASLSLRFVCFFNAGFRTF